MIPPANSKRKRPPQNVQVGSPDGPSTSKKTLSPTGKGKGEDEDEDVVPPPLEPTEALQHTTGPGTVHDSDQFHAGLVFSTPWHETYTQNSPNPAIAVEQESETAMTRLGKVISKMRKFVILKRYPQHSVALAIWSYGGKGLEGGQIQEIMSAYVTANSMPMIGQIVRTRIFSLADWRSTRTDEANTGASSMGRLTASLRVRSRLGT